MIDAVIAIRGIQSRRAAGPRWDVGRWRPTDLESAGPSLPRLTSRLCATVRGIGMRREVAQITPEQVYA